MECMRKIRRVARSMTLERKRLLQAALCLALVVGFASGAFAQAEDPVLPDIGFAGTALIDAFGTSLGALLVKLVGLGLVIFGAWRVLRWTRRATA